MWSLVSSSLVNQTPHHIPHRMDIRRFLSGAARQEDALSELMKEAC